MEWRYKGGAGVPAESYDVTEARMEVLDNLGRAESGDL